MAADETIILGVISAFGGEVVGRTRLQKVMYFLDRKGFVPGLDYSYHHYGPYSQVVSNLTNLAKANSSIVEESRYGSHGVPYSVFTANDEFVPIEKPYQDFVDLLRRPSALDLELAATLDYLRNIENVSDPEAELFRRKPTKANSQSVNAAKELLASLAI